MKWIGYHQDIFKRRNVFGEVEISKVSGQPTLELSAWSETATSAHAGRIKFLKSGTASLDTYTAGNHTTAGEILGRIEAYGIDDSDGETLSSYIEFANDSISDADSSPGIIRFATSDADDAGTPTIRMIIKDNGAVNVLDGGLKQISNSGDYAVTSLSTKASAATSSGGRLALIQDDGAALANGHRLGVIEFKSTPDGSASYRNGARIEAMADAAWSLIENGTRLDFYTTDGNATESKVLSLNSNKLATFSGTVDISPANDVGRSALTIDNDDVDQYALYVDAANTTADAIHISAQAITTRSALGIDCNSLTTGSGISLDVDDALTTNSEKSLLIIDYDKAGVTGGEQTNSTIGLDINMADAATNNADATVTNTGVNVTIDAASNQGFINQTGYSATLTDGDVATTIGYYSQIEDGGVDFKAVSSTNSSSYFSIATTTYGATTLTTHDNDLTAANLTFEVDGDIYLKSATANWRWWKTGNPNDFLNLAIGTHGDAKFKTVDAAATAAHFEIEADGNIILDAAGDIALEAAGNDVTVDADTLTITSSTGDYPQVKLSNTTDDDQGAQLNFEKLRADDGVATGQNLGEIHFRGQDSAQNTQLYSYIISEIDVSTNGQESGKLNLGVCSHNGTSQPGLILTGGSVAGEVDVTIGRQTTSVTTVAGDLTVNGDTTTFSSANANDPVLIIENTTDDAESGRIQFNTSRGADGQDGDHLGAIEFWGYDDGTPSSVLYGKILTEIDDATDGEESGEMQLRVASHDGELQPGVVITGGSVEDEVDVTIGNGTASVTTIAGDLAVTGSITNGHLMHYDFRGYATGDGTNYEIPVLLTDNQAPWEHNTGAGSDGLTAQTVQTQMRMGGKTMPRACTLKKWTGWSTCGGSSTAYIGLFKLTPVRNDNSNRSLVLLKETSYTALGNAKAEDFAETSFTDDSIAAGDILVTGIKCGSGNTLYFTSTIEVEF